MNCEALWLEKIKNGDYSWFPELVAEYQDRIYAMAWRFTLNHADAEDLAQDIFLLIYRKLHTFRQEAALSTWIYRVAYNKAVRKKPVPQTVPLLADNAAPAKEYDFSSQLDLHNAISQLDKIYRAVIELYYFQDLSAADISEVLRLPLRTVETRIYRARNKLRTLLLVDDKDGRQNG
ncbi:MAG: RNA polymerase sigma factor [Christensenellales bacterium]